VLVILSIMIGANKGRLLFTAFSFQSTKTEEELPYTE